MKKIYKTKIRRNLFTLEFILGYSRIALISMLITGMAYCVEASVILREKALRAPVFFQSKGKRVETALDRAGFEKYLYRLNNDPRGLSDNEFEEVLREIIKIDRVDLMLFLQDFRLLEEYKSYKYFKDSPLSSASLRMYCGQSMSDIKDITSFLAGDTKEVKICTYQASDLFGGPNHGFSVVKYKGKYYLVDVTFIQFFDRNRIEFDTSYEPKGTVPKFLPWYILDRVKNPDWNETANLLLRDGYLELTDEVANMYGCLLRGNAPLDKSFRRKDILKKFKNQNSPEDKDISEDFGILGYRCFRQFDGEIIEKLDYYLNEALQAAYMERYKDREEFEEYLSRLTNGPEGVSSDEFEKILAESVKVNRAGFLFSDLKKDFNNPLSPEALKGNCTQGRADMRDILEFFAGTDENIEIKPFRAEDIFDGHTHAFSVVGYKNKYYILDTTFIQYFNRAHKEKKEENFTRMSSYILDKYSIEQDENMSVLLYPWHMLEKLKNPEWNKMAYNLLRDGYLELTDESADMYGCLLRGKAPLDKSFKKDDILKSAVDKTSQNPPFSFEPLEGRAFKNFDENIRSVLADYLDESLKSALGGEYLSREKTIEELPVSINNLSGVRQKI